MIKTAFVKGDLKVRVPITLEDISPVSAMHSLWVSIDYYVMQVVLYSRQIIHKCLHCVLESRFKAKENLCELEDAMMILACVGLCLSGAEVVGGKVKSMWLQCVAPFKLSYYLEMVTVYDYTSTGFTNVSTQPKLFLHHH